MTLSPSSGYVNQGDGHRLVFLFRRALMEGAAAYRAGQPKSTNPYPLDTPDGLSLRWGWNEGWDEAEQLVTGRPVEVGVPF